MVEQGVGMSWTSKLIEDLVRLWNEGASTAEIGRQLGISKNAVVGKAHRLSLAARPSPIKRQTATVTKLTGPTCQWPIGDPRNPEFRFCNEPTAAGKPYCTGHCAVAYTRSSSSSASRAA